MGAVERSDNVKVRNKKKNGITKQKFSKQVGSHNTSYPPSLLSHPFAPPAAMRPRPPFPMGRMPPPGMGPMPPPGVRLLPPPPGACPPLPLFRNRVPPPPPPGRMGPRGPLPPMPPMRARPPLMGPPPLMRPPPPMMGPRRFPPRLPPPPPPMLPPNKMRQLKHKMHGKKNNKKKNQAQLQVDLSTPWVTNNVKREFETKDKLFATAKESNKLDDWDKFKEQRSKCDKMYKTAKLDYTGMHPEEVFEEEYSDEEMSEYGCEERNDYAESNRETSGYFCDACERGFANAGQLKHHMQQHRVCGIDGCTFVAHEKIVEKHINMQHVTGLYYRIAKTNTPEDIAKWIEERKKKYPTKENIEKRQQQQQEMVKRGERIQLPKDRFGKNQKKDVQPHNLKRLDSNKKLTPKGKVNQHKVPSKRRKLSVKPEVLKTSLLDDRSDWNGNLPPFQGTSELYEDEEKSHVENIIDDSEWLEPGVSKCETNNYVIKTETSKLETTNSLIEPEVPKIETNALGALMGAYGSSDDSDNETVEPESKSIESVVKSIEKSEIDAGDEPPEEQKIIRQDINEPKVGKCENIPETITNNKKQNSRCRNRKRKRKLSKEESAYPNVTVNDTGDQKMVRRRVTLLERLLASEIKHERNVILQCVRHVVQNNFFEKTEHSTETYSDIPCSSQSSSVVLDSKTADEEHGKEICDNENRKETLDNADTNIEIKSDE